MSNLKSRHAFGSKKNLSEAIQNNLIDAHDIIFLKEGEICWLDGEGNLVQHDTKKIEFVDELPESGEEKVAYVYNNKFYFWNGEEFVSSVNDCGMTEAVVDEKISAAKKEAAENAVEVANVYTNEKLETVKRIKYEITSKPVGTLVNYGENEIRVMCPTDTKWVKQNVGSTGNANMYYMGFKAYAPENAVSFKEGDQGVIVDEMFDFNGSFAGTDEFGRNYSIVWLALASYDESSNEWTYYGEKSTVSKYIGWTYVVEWYDADGVVIASDSIRINLSNEKCHSSIEPYYVNDVIKTANAYTDEKIAEATVGIEIIEF